MLHLGRRHGDHGADHDTDGGQRHDVDSRHDDGFDRTTAGDYVDRQHAAYGGIKPGAAFFGWLSANGLAVILVALLSAAGVALRLTNTEAGDAVANAVEDPETVGLVGGILLLVVLMLAYYAGGYVAGRMARFDGVRQGVAVWAFGLVIIVALAVAGALLGAEYNVFTDLNLPRIPIDEGTLTTGGILALLAVLVGTLLAAMAGGKAGEHYHRKVDRAGELRHRRRA